MNPLTNVKNLQKLNERELKMGYAGDDSKSWHQKYKDSAWIFVGGLAYGLSEGDVIAVFSQYGEIVNINLVRDKQSGKSRGFCFICYEDQRSTNLAVDNFNGIKVAGRVLRVDHVEEYKIPKEKGDEDDIVKKLHMEGCAPDPSSSETHVRKIHVENVKYDRGSPVRKPNESSPKRKHVDADEKKYRIKLEKQDNAPPSERPSRDESKSNRREYRDREKSPEIKRKRDDKTISYSKLFKKKPSDFEEQTSNKSRTDEKRRSFDLCLKSIVDELPFQTKLSSAGLIYAHFGKDVIRHILSRQLARCSSHESPQNNTVQNDETTVDESLLAILYKKCYAEFVEEIDANDNGIDQFDTDLQPKFRITTTLSNRVAGLNPAWNEKNKTEDEQFEKAMDLVGSELVDRIAYFHNVWWPARTLVLKAFQSRSTVDQSGEVMVLETGCPWKEHLFDIEQEHCKSGSIKFCTLYDEKNDYWMIVCVPLEPKSFKLRCPFPENLRGLRSQELSDIANVENCVFVHANGFCGANKTKDGALTLIRQALGTQKKDN